MYPYGKLVPCCSVALAALAALAALWQLHRFYPVTAVQGCGAGRARVQEIVSLMRQWATDLWSLCPRRPRRPRPRPWVRVQELTSPMWQWATVHPLHKVHSETKA